MTTGLKCRQAFSTNTPISLQLFSRTRRNCKNFDWKRPREIHNMRYCFQYTDVQGLSIHINERYAHMKCPLVCLCTLHNMYWLIVYLWSQLPRRLADEDFHWRAFQEMGWPLMNGKWLKFFHDKHPSQSNTRSCTTHINVNTVCIKSCKHGTLFCGNASTDLRQQNNVSVVPSGITVSPRERSDCYTSNARLFHSRCPVAAKS